MSASCHRSSSSSRRLHNVARGMARCCTGIMIGLGPSFAAAELEPIAPTPVQELNHLLSQATTTAQWLEQRQQFVWRGAPYGLTGMPVTVMNAQRRWTYGGRLHLANYSDRPYHFHVVSEWV